MAEADRRTDEIRIAELVARGFEALAISVRNHAAIVTGAPVGIEYWPGASRAAWIGKCAFIEQVDVRAEVEAGRAHQAACIDHISCRSMPRRRRPVRIAKVPRLASASEWSRRYTARSSTNRSAWARRPISGCCSRAGRGCCAADSQQYAGHRAPDRFRAAEQARHQQDARKEREERNRPAMKSPPIETNIRDRESRRRQSMRREAFAEDAATTTAGDAVSVIGSRSSESRRRSRPCARNSPGVDPGRELRIRGIGKRKPVIDKSEDGPAPVPAGSRSRSIAEPSRRLPTRQLANDQKRHDHQDGVGSGQVEKRGERPQQRQSSRVGSRRVQKHADGPATSTLDRGFSSPEVEKSTNAAEKSSTIAAVIAWSEETATRQRQSRRPDRAGSFPRQTS